MIYFLCDFKRFNAEQYLQAVVEDGVKWARKHKLKVNPNAIYHDALHSLSGRNLDVVSASDIKKEMSLNGLNSQDSLDRLLDKTDKSNLPIEDYILGLEGRKAAKVDYPLQYWKGRRDRKRKLGKEFIYVQNLIDKNPSIVNKYYRGGKLVDGYTRH